MYLVWIANSELTQQTPFRFRSVREMLWSMPLPANYPPRMIYRQGKDKAYRAVSNASRARITRMAHK